MTKMAEAETTPEDQRVFAERLSTVQHIQRLTIQNSNEYLQKLPTLSPTELELSLLMLDRYLNFCNRELILMKEKREQNFFGQLADQEKLNGLQKSLEDTVENLKKAKADLKAKGYTNSMEETPEYSKLFKWLPDDKTTT